MYNISVRFRDIIRGYVVENFSREWNEVTTKIKIGQFIKIIFLMNSL